MTSDVEYIRKELYDELLHENKNLIQTVELQKYVMDMIRENTEDKK